MTRPERRREKKSILKKQKSRMMTVAAIDALKHEVTVDSTNTAFSVLLGLSTYALRAEFNFNGEQLEAFVERVMSAYRAFEDGKLSINDIHAIVYQETGLTIHDTTGGDILPAAKTTRPKNRRENDDIAVLMTRLIEEYEAAKIEEGTNVKTTMEKN